MPAKSAPPVFCKRLREARLAAGLSQKRLGQEAGLDEFVASARINRYETGTHEPHSDMVARLAGVLGVPVAYLHADDDRLAAAILAFSQLGRREQDKMLKVLEAAFDPRTP